ncbi:MAG: hypothetical protein IPM26_09370 [Saprospiraceae bacterium]|nr:hypothetical protein [Saprospiraceae bacterium]
MSRFAATMGLSVLFSLLFLLLLDNFYHNESYLIFGFWCIALFVLSSIPVVFFFMKIVRSPNKTLFISATVGNMLFKMILAFLMVFVFYKKSAPADGNFILYFLVVYVIFTIFETYMLLRIAEQKPMDNR